MAKKRQKIQMPAGIRNKMMAAVSMLMVSAIMMVSSSYAWFTLSTAPEVTGITTNVGANGNLEMMLLNPTTYTSTAEDLGVVSQVGDSMAVADVLKANETWGNLVDLSSSSYGLSSITLMPSKLNIENTTIGNIPLYAPSYGSDGRVIEVETATYPGAYAAGAWTYDESAAGVRALGTSSGTTVRLSTYRTALAAANTATNNAKSAAQTSLSANAQPLATLLVDKVQGAISFSNSYLANLKSIIDGVTTANGYVETAIKNAVLAYSLSAANTNDLGDDAVKTLKTAVEAASLDELSNVSGVIIPLGISDAISTYKATADALNTASKNYESVKDLSTDLTWEQVNNVLQPLVDQDYMSINGKDVATSTKDDLIGAIIPKDGELSGINVEIAMFGNTSGDAGVYYKLAKICGKYNVSGKVTVSYNGITATAPFTMTQKVTDSEAYMAVTVAAIQTAGAPAATVGGESTVSLSDTYGYMLDFGFRTNAAGSSLLLQTDAMQRVYNSTGDASTATTTQGSGSYMQFTSTDVNSFSLSEVRALMSAIRVAFVQPNLTDDNYDLLAVGALDINATTGADGVITYSSETEEKSTTVSTDDTLKIPLNLRSYTVDGEGYITLGNKLESQTITALAQNVASKITVIVYLDGEIVDNTMVANAAQSMYGSLNLQFSSTATLVPMENSGMRTNGGMAAIDSSVTFTQKAVAGDTYEIGDYEGTVKTGVTIYEGSDKEIYYSLNGGPKYLLTSSNYMNAISVTVNTENNTQTEVTGGENTPSGESGGTIDTGSEVPSEG